MSGDGADAAPAEGRLIYEKAGPIARVVFDNQKAHNALTFAMWRQLGDVCRQIAEDPEVRVATFRGAGGKSFISGTDISGFHKFTSGRDGVLYEKEMDQYIGAVEALPIPTVAIVDGWAVGGGLAISFACDFRIATPKAKFGSPLAKTIGNCLSMKGYTRLVENVGVSYAKRILILGEMITAAQAHDMGAVLQVVEPEELDAAAEALCQNLIESAPLTTKSSKTAIRRLMYAGIPDIDDLIEEVYGSDDFRNAVRAFIDKKPRVWTGR